MAVSTAALISLQGISCTTYRIHVTTPTGSSEVWQARIERGFAAQLHEDAATLGLQGRTNIVRAGLQLLHRQAAEERMASSVDTFYDGATPPLPIGVLPDDEDEREANVGASA